MDEAGRFVKDKYLDIVDISLIILDIRIGCHCLCVRIRCGAAYVNEYSPCRARFRLKLFVDEFVAGCHCDGKCSHHNDKICFHSC